LNDAAAQIVALANYARTQSIAQGKIYRMSFDLANGSYVLTARTYDVFDKLGNEFGEQFTLPEGVRMDCDFQPQQDGLYLEFRSTGRNDTGTIRLTGDGGSVKQIVCESPTELYHVVD